MGSNDYSSNAQKSSSLTGNSKWKDSTGTRRRRTTEQHNDERQSDELYEGGHKGEQEKSIEHYATSVQPTSKKPLVKKSGHTVTL